MNAVAYTIACNINGRIVYLSEFYLANTEQAVKQQVLEKARREGFIGTANERLAEFGWSVAPLYPK